MRRTPEPAEPWGRCPRCGRPLVREKLALQSWPGSLSMQGPPTCPVCTPEEIDRYLEEWGTPSEWDG